MFDWVLTAEGWVALATLSFLEIVLGVDNIVFISVLVSRLPAETRDKARKIGIMLAMISRLLLLLLLFWIASLSFELFQVFGKSFSLRDIVLILGGMFLIWKSTMEIHEHVEGVPGRKLENMATATFYSVVFQIAIIDIVFSLDSVITAIGMVKHVTIMVIAIVLSVIFMVIFSGVISGFVEKHPTIKVLALSFLLMVGLALVADGFGLHIPKGYIYFAMSFSIFVEMLNLRARKNIQGKG